LHVGRELRSRIDDGRRMDAAHGDLPVPERVPPLLEYPNSEAGARAVFFQRQSVLDAPFNCV
jgi:hypothetical protein